MKRDRISSLATWLVPVALLSAAGCSDKPASTPADAAVTPDVSGDVPTSDTPVTPDVSNNDAAQDAGTSLRFLTQFSLAMGQLPEGIAIRDNVVYVGFAPTGQIMRIDAMGTATMFGQVPIPPSMNPAMPNGYLLGLTFDAAGNLYAGAASFGAAFMAGIYRLPPTGGTATLFARDAMNRMNFPNGLAFDAMGNLFVTESGGGSIFKISPDGMTVTPWITDALLHGGSTMCGPGAGFPIGANGIVIDGMGMNVYVTNTDDASIIRIPIAAGGAAGTPAVLVPRDCMRLGGADGLTRGSDGALYATANGINAITRIPLDGMNLSVLERGGLLDSPASLLFGTLMGQPTLFITNAAFTSAQTMPAMARPGLLVRPAM